MENMVLHGLAAVGAAAIVLVFNRMVKQLCARHLARRGMKCL